MKKITVIPDQSKSYWSIHQAILDCGYVEVEDDIYEKDGKYYGFLEGLNFNTTVLEVTFLEMDDIREFSYYIRDVTLLELKEELSGKTFMLDELNSKCKSITKDGVDIFDYSISDFLDRDTMSGSFAWGCDDNQIGIYDVQFKILKYNEDLGDILVEVTDISIV